MFFKTDQFGFLSTKYLSRILLVLLTAITFFNILDNGFVYDDNTVIGENTRVSNLRNIRYLFSKKYFRIVGKGKEYAFGEASYRPTVTATYFIDALIFKGTSWGCHLTNLLIHISNVLLVFFFLSIGLGLRKKISLFGGLLFAVHPLVTEPVNAVAFREDLLVVFFCMAGMVSYLIYREKVLSPRKKIVIALLHGFFYLLALFAKESAIVYPILFLMVLFYKKFSIRREFALLCLLAAITVFYLIIRFFVMVNPNVEYMIYPGGKISSNFYTMATVFFGYIKLSFAPITLLADYNIEHKRNFLDFQVVRSTVLLVPLFFGSIYFFIKKKSLWAFGSIWFFICLAPVSNAIPIVNIFAERYLYFPLIGLVVFAVSFLEKILKINKRNFLLIFLFLCLIFVSRSVVRNNDWHDTQTLWNCTMRIEPDSHRALSNLATHYFQQKNYKKAIESYLASLQIKQNAQNRYNLANCYMRIKDYNQAVIEFNKALKLDPSYSEIYNNLALTYLYMDFLDKAEDTLKKSIVYRRPDVMYYENLGLVKDKQGSHKTAIKCFQKALVLNPDKPSIYNKIGVSYYHIGEEKKCLQYWFKGIKRFPDNPNFYKNLAVYYHEKNNPQKEIFYWEKAHKVDPQDVSVLENIITFYHKNSNRNKTVYYMNKLNKLKNRKK